MAAIQLWVGNIRLARAMERKELAQLSGIQRHLALSKGLLPNIIRVCRSHPRADTRLGVLAIIHLLADNNEGLCFLAVERFAELLSRKVDNVRLAIDALEKDGVIGIIRSKAGNSYWPKVDAEIAHMSPSMAWFVDALSHKPEPVGRPKKYPPADGGCFSGESVYHENHTPLDPKMYPRRQGTHFSSSDHLKTDNQESAPHFRGYSKGQANGHAKASEGVQ